MRVLLVVTGMSMGGAERVVADLADAMAKAGHDVMLIYLKEPMEVWPRCPEVRVACVGINSAADLLPGLVRFRRLVREFKPDVVHSHMFHATLVARLARMSTRIPCLVSTMHTAYDGGKIKALTYRCSDRLSDISTNVSVEAVEAFVAGGAVRPGRMLALYNGIDVDEFRPSAEARTRIRSDFDTPAGCRLFFAAGRLGWSKDYPNMFKALALLPQDLEYRLLIAGDGPLRASLEKMVVDLGLSARVHFLGIRRDIPTLMAAADVFLLSSVGEGFGLVVAEAMASECLVVATDAGGVREVLGDAGFLVPRQDPRALADAVVTACAMATDAAHTMGSSARHRIVENYSFNRAVERWLELYTGLLAKAERHANAGTGDGTAKAEVPLARP
jgi:glycosyltransferase involved in cell wall biosynthesis